MNGDNVKKIIFVLLLCSLLVSGCAESPDSSNVPQKVEAGDSVSVNYTGSLEDGTVFDTSIEENAVSENVYNPYRTYEPLSFVAGTGQMIKGFDDAVIGMEIGEEKTVSFPPEEAYGAHSSELVVTVPVEAFESANMTPVLGQKVSSQNMQGTVINISAENVTIDYNHDLAGETLIFTIELVSIEKAE